MNLKLPFDTIYISGGALCQIITIRHSVIGLDKLVRILLKQHMIQKALGYAGHVAGHQNWAAKVGLDFGRPENQSKHKRAVNQ
ncbi:hypothetical protein CM15mP43_05540 [bacterium]|nr:MAG: hypothetical protein CM15mP43_05540 [bacterium]